MWYYDFISPSRKRERENELEQEESAKRQKDYEKKWDVSYCFQ